MAKLAITVLVLRVLQLALGIAFIVFWSWSCASKFVVGGGAGEYVLGYLTALISIAVCIHTIWSFVRKQHLEQQGALYHNARWAVDLFVVALWLGTILLNILMPIRDEDQNRQLGGHPSMTGPSPSATDPIVVTGAGASATELFSAITFFMTSLLLVITAVRSRRSKGGAGGGVNQKSQATEAPPAPQTIYA